MTVVCKITVLRDLDEYLVSIHDNSYMRHTTLPIIITSWLFGLKLSGYLNYVPFNKTTVFRDVIRKNYMTILDVIERHKGYCDEVNFVRII